MYFSKIDLKDDCNSSSSEVDNSITNVSLGNASLFLFIKFEIPENFKIMGFQFFLKIDLAINGARDEPSSVIKHIGLSGSFLIKSPGGAIRIDSAIPSVT